MAKQGRFAKKKKKSFAWLWILLVLLLLGGLGWFFLSGIDAHEASKPQNETTAPSATSSADVPEPENTVPETTEPPVYALTPSYEMVLSRYHQALAEDWEFIECEDNQISYMVMFLENLDRLGYYLADLDNNGTPELIISDGNVIYDLYTDMGGQAVWILSGGERNAYNLCEDGLISNNGSGGAASHMWKFYRLEGDKLVLVQGVTFEGSSEGSTWKLTEGNDEPTIITEVQANIIIASHRHIPIAVTPIP